MQKKIRLLLLDNDMHHEKHDVNQIGFLTGLKPNGKMRLLVIKALRIRH